MTSTGRLVTALAVLASLTLAAGCSDSRSRAAAAVRRQRIQRHWDRFCAYENAGPSRLRQTFDLIEDQERLHAEHRRISSRRLADRWRYEVDRWQDGQPEYRGRIERELQGDRAQAEWAAHHMFD